MRNKKKRNLWLMIIVLPVLLFQASQPMNRITGVEDFDVDILGQVYTLSHGVLNKYDKNFVKQNSFSDFSLGDISSFEAVDALNIMAYYTDNEKIIFLDNNLNMKKSAISLSSLGYDESSLACASYNTGFWIFTPVGSELIRFNRLLEKTNASGNLRQITGESIHPQIIRETNNTVILSDTNSGVYLFDRYGAYIRKIPFLNVVDFQLNNNKLSMLKRDSLFSYDLKTLQIDTISLNKKVVRFKLSTDLFYYLNCDGILKAENLPHKS